MLHPATLRCYLLFVIFMNAIFYLMQVHVLFNPVDESLKIYQGFSQNQKSLTYVILLSGTPFIAIAAVLSSKAPFRVSSEYIFKNNFVQRKHNLVLLHSLFRFYPVFFHFPYLSVIKFGNYSKIPVVLCFQNVH